MPVVKKGCYCPIGSLVVRDLHFKFSGLEERKVCEKSGMTL